MNESYSSGAAAPTYITDDIRGFTGEEMFPSVAALTEELTQTTGKYLKSLEVISSCPESAKLVRARALEAHTTHVFATSLMKKVGTTTSQMMDTTFPNIWKSVDDGDTDTIKANLAMIIEWAEEMKRETENVRGRYMELTEKLQEDLVEVKKNRQDKKRKNRKRRIVGSVLSLHPGYIMLANSRRPDDCYFLGNTTVVVKFCK